MNDINSRYYGLVYDYLCGTRKFTADLLENQSVTEHEKRIQSIQIPRPGPVESPYAELKQKIDMLFAKGCRSKLIENIIVHGSYGDYTANCYSDIDLTIIFKDNIFSSKSFLLKARKFVVRDVIPLSLSIDPFQHHGPFVLWPRLMAQYRESILPAAVYRHAWAAAEATYTFSILQTEPDDLKLNLTRKKLFMLGRACMQTKDLYLIKRFLSNLMLIPAFFQLAKGRPCHKAVAFQRFEASVGSFEALASASALRTIWPVLPYYRTLSRLLAPILARKPLQTGAYLGRASRLFRHPFCSDYIDDCYAGLASLNNAISGAIKNG